MKISLTVECSKVCNSEFRFLNFALCIMLLNICVKFHENILNCFEVTGQTRVCDKIAIFKCSNDNKSKKCNPELRFLHSAHRLILFNIFVKYHENIANGSMFKGR